jgi:hypothetical protein
MKFAEKYPTEEELSNAVRKFPTRHAMTQKGLTTTPRVDEQGTEDVATDPGGDEPQTSESAHRRVQKDLQRALTTVENIEATAVHVDDLELLTRISAAIQRLQEAVEYLRKEVA